MEKIYENIEKSLNGFFAKGIWHNVRKKYFNKLNLSLEVLKYI